MSVKKWDIECIMRHVCEYLEERGQCMHENGNDVIAV